MAGFYGFSSYGSLFGGRSSAMSSIYSNLAEYASVRSGAYAKAAKAYYAKVATSESKKANSSEQSESSGSILTGRQAAFSNTALSSVKSKASELNDSAKKLTAAGKDSLFSKEGYDKDTVYKAVSDFVGKYNNTLSSVKGTDNVAVNSAANSMTRMTGVMRNSLSEVGISVGTDGRLSVDEEAFKNADESKVKKLFNGSSSYAGVISDSASRIVSQASNQLANAGGSIYGNSGSYYNNFTRGLFYNGYF
ncbi:MAG: hypothetical protein IJ661_12615 [Lachnospiraceae bacterium]|nr:hypothetical protein [Lachnospiraceae bacterium]